MPEKLPSPSKIPTPLCRGGLAAKEQRALTSPGLPLLALPGNQEGLVAIHVSSKTTFHRWSSYSLGEMGLSQQLAPSGRSWQGALRTASQIGLEGKGGCLKSPPPLQTSRPPLQGWLGSASQEGLCKEQRALRSPFFAMLGPFRLGPFMESGRLSSEVGRCHCLSRNLCKKAGRSGHSGIRPLSSSTINFPVLYLASSSSAHFHRPGGAH